MTRIEENEKIIECINELNGQLQLVSDILSPNTLNDRIISTNTAQMVLFLGDISKSLAVIADNMEGNNVSNQ